MIMSRLSLSECHTNTLQKYENKLSIFCLVVANQLDGQPKYSRWIWFEWLHDDHMTSIGNIRKLSAIVSCLQRRVKTDASLLCMYPIIFLGIPLLCGLNLQGGIINTRLTLIPWRHKPGRANLQLKVPGAVLYHPADRVSSWLLSKYGLESNSLYINTATGHCCYVILFQRTHPVSDRLRVDPIG